MPNLDDEEPPADVDTIYRSIFSEHLEAFRAHLSGRDGEELLKPSYFPPNACWSASEKNAFFHGLAIHSRLRPDLIAQEVNTKTLADVCAYIAMLEEADQEMTMHLRKTSIVTKKIARKDIPAAVEVTDKWLAFEEGLAETMAAAHAELEQTVVKEKDREEEIQRQKANLRAAKREGRTAANERDREGEKARREEFERWLAQKQADWEGEDLLLSLDRVGLTTLDRMLREDEEGHAFADKNAGFEFSDDETAPQDVAAETSQSQPPLASTPVVGIDEALIDPFLLELSRDTHSFSTLATSTNPNPLADVSSANPSTTRPSTPHLPSAVPEGLPGHVPPLLSVNNLDPSAKADEVSTIDGEDVSQMSPTSRRRLQKRLHMRRKRAEAAGLVANEAAHRLKPGRKPKQRPLKAHPSTSAAEDEAMASSPFSSRAASAAPHVSESGAAQEGEGSDDNAEFRHHKMSGKTRTYKRREEFVSKGVDIPRLRREGLDLFHLQTVSKLMHTYNELHDVPDTVASEISAETLRLLHAIVVQFVSEVMSRAVVYREQERIAKLQTKAWRLRETQLVSAANVKHALVLYGADALSKRRHFAGLLRKLDIETDEEGEQDQSETEYVVSSQAMELDYEEDGESNDSNLPFEPPSLLRSIFPPFMNPPLSSHHVGDGDDAHSLNPAVYMSRPSSTVLSKVPEALDDDDLLPEDVDEAEWLNELHEENVLDREDSLRDEDDERTLWARVSTSAAAAPAKPVVVAATEDTPEPVRTVIVERPPRKRRRRAVGKAEVSCDPVTDGGSAEERDVEAELLGAGMDVDTVERVAPKGATKRKRKKAKAKLSERQLLFQEPDASGPIKSSVYVLDSD